MYSNVSPEHEEPLTTLYASFTYSLFSSSCFSLSGDERFGGVESLRRFASGACPALSFTIWRNSDVLEVTAMSLRETQMGKNEAEGLEGACCVHRLNESVTLGFEDHDSRSRLPCHVRLRRQYIVAHPKLFFRNRTTRTCSPPPRDVFTDFSNGLYLLWKIA